MDGLEKVIVEEMPVGVLVIDERIKPIFVNKVAKRIFRRFKVPKEIYVISKRIIQAIATDTLSQSFTGEILLSRKMEGASNIWTFQFHIHAVPKPRVIVYATEDKLSGKVDLSALRGKYKLTRRETDVVRRVLDGLRNSQIAEDLGITDSTAKEHLRNIYSKVGVNNRVALINRLLSTKHRDNT